MDAKWTKTNHIIISKIRSMKIVFVTGNNFQNIKNEKNTPQACGKINTFTHHEDKLQS